MASVEEDTAKSLAEKKLDAEIAKLLAEKAELERPFFHKASFWITLIPTVIALSGVVKLTSDLDHEKQTAELVKKEAELATQVATFKVEQAESKVENSKEELKKKQIELMGHNEQLAGIEKKLADKNKQILELIKKQFDMYGQVCDAAGEVAAANDWENAVKAFNKLEVPEVSMINTDSIYKAIEALRKKLEPDMRTGLQPEDLRSTVLGVSKAARTAWFEERDATIPINGEAVVALEAKFKAIHYQKAQEVTRKIAGAPNYDDVEEDRRQFWRLYFGNMVLVESQGEDSVAWAMVEFGDTLLAWKSGEPSAMIRKQLKEAVASLEDACQRDLVAKGNEGDVQTVK
jgi:hypothetical protein